jgi:hypothetical protein
MKLVADGTILGRADGFLAEFIAIPCPLLDPLFCVSTGGGDGDKTIEDGTPLRGPPDKPRNKP